MPRLSPRHLQMSLLLVFAVQQWACAGHAPQVRSQGPQEAPSAAAPSLAGGAISESLLLAETVTTPGLLVIQCVISTEGVTHDCKPLSVEDVSPANVASVLQYMEGRRFQPVTYRGKPVSVSYRFNVRLNPRPSALDGGR